MKTIQKINELKAEIKAAKSAGQKVGFVPTMGYFHEGHLSLMRRAKIENDLVVVSLFVNPIQFNVSADLQSYPRDLERDQAMTAGVGVDLLFAPEGAEIYPPEFQSLVEVTGVSQGLCGASRPGHFRGVTTVVLKLFNMVEPDRAYFGEKDAQQLRVIKRMAVDLNLNIQVIGCPIIREADGLAMSSRNVHLTPNERQAALVLFRTLTAAKKFIEGGVRQVAALRPELIKIIQAEPLADLDYLEIVDSISLKPIEQLAGEVLIALAVYIGRTRLIDNMVYHLPEKR